MLTQASMMAHKLDMMDKLLKVPVPPSLSLLFLQVVAATASQQNAMAAPKQEPGLLGGVSPPAYREERRDRRSQDGEEPEEIGRRTLRRERNKQAAARCRKRRLDLTQTLQVRRGWL